ncbi:MAG: acyl-CoA dehydrogenase [Desulfobacterium sp.]|nr:acyl-CoA dehydrogenase [Desulfobacterium sp.]MBU3946846.1 acyl-CoA dehydrogenase family protein [Pseudomonadota bacterium]MBU4036380.1 acyl-CoA dehydrogenase family protein [Pseudomonadota bacterium]
MDFELSEEQIMFRDQIRNFAETEIAPLVDEAEEKEVTPLQLFPMMGKLGYLGITYAEKYGGAEVDKITECILIEELNKVCAGIAGVVSTTHSGLGTRAINDYGTEEQKQRFLVPAIKGEKIAAFALTEADAGSDAIALRTRAVKDGDDYIINGSKMFISNGTFCDFVPVACYTTDPKEVKKRGQGISLIVVEKGMPGFSATKLKKSGNRSHETAQLYFEDVRVPKENLIGEEGKGLAQILTTLKSGRISYGARATGMAQAAYDLAFKYAHEREQFGKQIAKFQINTVKLVDMAMHIDIMRIMTYRAAWMYSEGMNCMKEACMLKIYATEKVQELMLLALDLHGGYGYMREYAIERLWRDAKMLNLTEGTTPINYMAAARELGI